MLNKAGVSIRHMRTVRHGLPHSRSMLLQVDVWASGILAYELVVGRPPFEVNDEVQTATMIMFSNNIVYPPKYSALWADFVKVALEKKPHMRPTALQMLDHPW